MVLGAGVYIKAFRLKRRFEWVWRGGGQVGQQGKWKIYGHFGQEREIRAGPTSMVTCVAPGRRRLTRASD